MSKKSIYELNSEIRALVSERRLQVALFLRHGPWHRFYTALDVISDVEMALDWYTSAPEFENNAQAYIEIYGVLQAIELRRQAVETLLSVLSLGKIQDTEINEIKITRIRASGHPTFSTQDKRSLTGLIVRNSMCRDSFKLYISSGDGNSKTQLVNIGKTMRRQEQVLARYLDQVLSQIRKFENAHREKFGGRSLRSCFPDSWTWMMGHVHSAVHSTDANDVRGDRTLAFTDLEILSEMTDSFWRALKERGEANLFGEHESKRATINRAFEQLRAFTSSRSRGNVSKIDASIYADHLEAEIKSLIAEAERLDAKYGSRV